MRTSLFLCDANGNARAKLGESAIFVGSFAPLRSESLTNANVPVVFWNIARNRCAAAARGVLVRRNEPATARAERAADGTPRSAGAGARLSGQKCRRRDP